MSNKQKDLIREVFLRNGFTIKDGRDDLADYVYAAAHDLLQALPAVQGEPSCKEMYKEFSEWCQNNRGFDLDCRLHTHGGPIDRGGYISDGETRVVFAAYRAGRLLASQPAEQQPLKSSLALEAATHLTNWLDADLCECAGGHTCGYNEVKRTRDALQAAAEQQPSPEVAMLVEALLKARSAVATLAGIRGDGVHEGDEEHARELRALLAEIDDLATYRKGGDA